MRLKRVGVLSVALTLGAVYAVLGLVIGLIFATISVLGMGLAAATRDSEGAGVTGVFGLIFGVGAVIVLPLFYGMLGFLGGALSSALYNVMAKLTGGIELTLE